MDDFHDQQVRHCTGILYAFSQAYGNDRKQIKLPTCFGITKTLPGVIGPHQLRQIKKVKPFNGKILSFGVSQYCGYMVRHDIPPMVSPGFQIRVSFDEDVPNQNNRNQSLRDQVHQNRNVIDNENVSSTENKHVNKTSAREDPFAKLERGSLKLFNSCVSLGTEINKSLHDDFVGRFRKSMSTLHTSLKDTASRVGEGSMKIFKLVKEATDNSSSNKK